jgi:anti-sigma B factor antagonist
MTSQLAENTLPDGHRVITASGELDRIELPSLRSAVKAAFAEVRRLILDMSDVTYIDSSVLAALITDSFEADKNGKRLVIVTGTGGIMRSLELKGLTQVMHITESVDEAVRLSSAES